MKGGKDSHTHARRIAASLLNRACPEEKVSLVRAERLVDGSQADTGVWTLDWSACQDLCSKGETYLDGLGDLPGERASEEGLCVDSFAFGWVRIRSG